MSWLDHLGMLTEPSVLVTIRLAEGSTPRAAGTQMIATATGAFGTIGGGQLEYKAIEAARALLMCGESAAATEQRFALGPSLGQCCGGAVTLGFARFDEAATPSLVRRLRAEYESSIDWSVQLFGAGHVGHAIVTALAPLPCKITWIDERAAQFPSVLPANVTVMTSDAPPDEVARASAGSYFIVLTHSHALDEDICAKVLARGDFAYLGLIGSATKRATFERRLKVRGFDAVSVARITCPIGIAGIESKEPAAIAIAVVAELLQVRELRSRVVTRPSSPHL